MPYYCEECAKEVNTSDDSFVIYLDVHDVWLEELLLNGRFWFCSEECAAEWGITKVDPSLPCSWWNLQVDEEFWTTVTDA
jgi:hypothetical protein